MWFPSMIRLLGITFYYFTEFFMEKETLLSQCNELLVEMQQELHERDFSEAMELLEELLIKLKQIEPHVDALSDEEEQWLDELIDALGDMDLDRMSSTQEILEILDEILSRLTKFRTDIVLWRTEKVYETLQNVNSLLGKILKKM